MTPIVERGTNPYRENVQGKANEPIAVAGLLDQASQALGLRDLDYSLGAIYDRLEGNAPRVAIVGGSADHPAHILDRPTALKAAARIWQRGGVPFYFSLPVLCDGTAQNNIGMSYSLQSRNAVTEMVVNQMEAHSYHGAYVLSGCDKTPLAIAAGLAHLDRTRQQRGDAPVFATFHPSHVLRGGALPPDLAADLEAVARKAEARGHPEIAADLRDTMAYILQCTTNSAFQGVLTRARQAGIISLAKHKDYERRLAVNTCEAKGGICAFNGTGNSSRHVVSALGLTHPAVELLTEPPDAGPIDTVVDDLFTFVNEPAYSVGSTLAANFANAVRVHSVTGGSTNLMIHLVAAMIYAGYDVDVWTVDEIRRNPPVPDIFDYSLTQGRDIFVLAQQCRSGAIRGMETVFYELLRQGIPMNLDAPTVTGQSWRERLSEARNLSAAGVTDNPIILTTPRRPFSGVEVLQSNFFESAVVKVSGMTGEQLAEFDDRVCLVLFFENEEAANAGLLEAHLLERLKAHPAVTRRKLLAMAAHNCHGKQQDKDKGPSLEALQALGRDPLLQRMAESGLLKLAVIVSGQGPEAFGMPEMFTPMQHINANRALRKLTVLISDGRYSGVTYGAAIGHVAPEALKDGGIGLVETGDLLHLQLSSRRVDLLDPEAFASGRLIPWEVDLSKLRRDLGAARRERILERQRQVAATNRLHHVTDASRGIVPLIVAEQATLTYR
ncbi:MAG: dihydroxy-acid dehydratase [Anaerolineae bacterium]|nr:MAG: dihydroxy-acid dehydratase [Anaerolineae bacterium]